MKTLGQFLIAIGLVLGLVAFSMKTTVPIESSFIGGTYLPSREVNNIGLMDDRRNYLLTAGVLLIVGVQLLIGSRHKQSSPTTGTTDANGQFVTGQFHGARDVTSDSYRLHLTRKYSIELNNTLGKYVVGDRLYASLEDALSFAHKRESDEQGLEFALRIQHVDAGFNGEKVGLGPGDVILNYGDTVIRSGDDLDAAVLLAEGQASTITILRDGVIHQLSIPAGRIGIFCEKTALLPSEQQQRLIGPTTPQTS